MKKIKKILLLLFPLFLSGCTIQYNIEIKEDLSFEENIIVKESYGFFNHLEKDVEGARNFIEATIKRNDENFTYNWNYLEEEKTYGVDMYKKYPTLEELEELKTIKFMYDGVEIERNNNYITLKTTGDINMALMYTYATREPHPDDDYTYIMKPIDTYFSVTIPFKVTNHNADKVNKETNTYYWLVSEKTTTKPIEITFDQNKKHFSIIATVKRFPFKILLFPIIAVIIYLLGRKVIEINKLNNEI